jgi:hypothetical protein
MSRPLWRENPTLVEALDPAAPPYPREGGQRNAGPRRRCRSCLALSDRREAERGCGRCGASLRHGDLEFGGRPDAESRPAPASNAKPSTLSEADVILACAETIEADLRDPVAVHALWTAASRCIEAADERDRERAERARSSELWRGSVSAADSMLAGA